MQPDVLFLWSNNARLVEKIKQSPEVLHYEWYVHEIKDFHEFEVEKDKKSGYFLLTDCSTYISNPQLHNTNEQIAVVFEESDLPLSQDFIKTPLNHIHLIPFNSFSFQKLSVFKNQSELETLSEIEAVHQVLIVDDVLSNLVLLEHFLKDDHKVLHKAQSVQEAIPIIFFNDIHLIVLDIQLPEINGYELAKFLKQNKFTQHIPIIFLTAFNKEPNQVVKGLEYGAIDYLYKPVDKNILKTKVNLLLKLFSYQDSLQKNNILLNTQKNIIHQKNNLLQESIAYAAKMQQLLIPDIKSLQQVFQEVEILFLPKDSVSGDFYLVKKIHDKIVWVIGDCTGHGVPGAILSSAVITILNNIFTTSNTLHAKSVLLEFYNTLHTMFHTSAQNSPLNDAADIGICIFDTSNQTLNYCGFNIPLWVLHNQVLEKIEPNRGLFFNSAENLNETTKPIQTQERYFMFTDGIYDQLSSNGFEKFKKVHLEHILTEHHQQNLAELFQVIHTHYTTWKGDMEQTDDICLMGVRV